MTLQLNLDPRQERELETLAQSEGVSVDEYAIRRLFPDQSIRTAAKPFRALQFAGVAPSGRTAAEVDTDIDGMRDEWDEHETSWRSTTPPSTP